MKKILSIFVILCIVFYSTIIFASEETELAGICGKNLTWKFKDGVLTISGTGEMYDYNITETREYRAPVPWKSFKNSITKVIICEGVTAIDDVAFYKCNNMATINIPDSMTSIGKEILLLCYGLENIVVSDSHQYYSSIDGNLFDKEKTTLIRYAQDKSDASYTVPNSVTAIGNSAFASCGNLTSITVPDSVSSIGNSAFSLCCNLTNITIPDSISSIGDAAFECCCNLTNITISNSVTSIGDCAFQGCDNLTNIIIPDSVTSIGENAFAECESLTSILVGDGNTAYSSIAGNLFDKKKTTLIRYTQDKSDASYTVPNSVTFISEHAFSDCDNLTNIIIPDSVTSIGENAFARCESLTSITIPDSVSSIGDGAFAGCDSLTSVTIPDSVTTIGEAVFTSCDGLTNITIPDSVTAIGDYAFHICKNLTNIIIPDNVISIGRGAFGRCESLTSITIPDSVTTIGDYAFNDCENLKSITISDSVNPTGSWSVKDCKSVTSVVISDGVTSIGDDAFSGCENLTSITIPDSVTSIGKGAFSSCDNLTSITIPDSVTSIGDFAFFSCDNLTNITIPGSVIFIGEDIFLMCYLENIYYTGTDINIVYKLNDSLPDTTTLHYDIENIHNDIWFSASGMREPVLWGNTARVSIPVSEFPQTFCVEGSNSDHIYSVYKNSGNSDTLTVGTVFNFHSIKNVVHNHIAYIESVGGIMTGYKKLDCQDSPYEKYAISWDIGEMHHYAAFCGSNNPYGFGYYDLEFADGSSSESLIERLNCSLGLIFGDA